MKRIALVIVAVFCLLIGGALVAPGFVDWSKYKDPIVSQIHEATGYDVSIAGHLELAVLPTPRLMIEGFSIASPAAGNIVSFERVDVSVALVPLLSKEVEVTRVRLLKPDVKLTVGMDGKPLWMPPAGSKNATDKAVGDNTAILESISLKEIEIDGGSLLFADKAKGTSHALDHIELSIKAESLLGPYVIDGGVAYKGKQIGVHTETGRIVRDSDSIAVQTTIDVPESASKVNYSGVIIYKGDVGVQGEVGITTNDLSALASLAVEQKKVPAVLKKAFSVQGVLTASKKEMTYKNMKMSLGSLQSSGSISAANIGAATPVTVEAKLDVSTVNLDDFLPAKGQKKSKQPVSFLPETISLPVAMEGKAQATIASARYNGGTLSDVVLSSGFSGKQVLLDLKVDAPANGTITTKTAIDFKSSSASEANGLVTLSDPIVKSTISVKGQNAGTLYSLFIPVPLPGNSKALLQNRSIDLTSMVTLESQKLSWNDTALKLGQDSFSLMGSLAKAQDGTAPDRLSLSVLTEGLDVDKWLEKIQDKTAAKKPLGKTLASFNPPFDLSVNATLRKSKIYGQEINEFLLKARTNKKKLTLETLSFKDTNDNSMTLSGSIGDYQKLQSIDMVISGKTNDAQPVLEALKVNTEDLPQIGSAEVLSEIKGHADSLAFTANIKALRGSVESSGVLKNVLTAAQVGDLSLRIKHPNYVQLINLFAPDFKSAVTLDKSFDFFTSMEESEGVYKFSEIKALLGPMSMTGNVTASVKKGVKPSIKGQLQFGDMPVGEFLGVETVKKGATRSQRSSQGTGTQGVRWSRDPVNTSFMHIFNADIKASATSISYGNWTFNNAIFEAVLKDGAFTLTSLKGSLYGGDVSMNGKVVSPENPREPLTINGAVYMKNVALEPFVQSFSGSRLLRTTGQFSMDTVIETAGISPAALIFDLHGKGGMDAVNLVIQGFDLARLSRTLSQPSSSMTENLNGLLGSTMSSGSTKFDTMHTAYTIRDGVITFDEMKLNGMDASVTGTGYVNLPIWSINMETEVKLATPADAPTLKAVFKGPLDNPAHTFGKGALDTWFQSQFGTMIENKILNKLQDKGIIRAQPIEKPAPQPATQTGEPTTDGTKPTQPAPQQQQPPKQVKPEDMFFNILQDVLQ